MAASNSLVERWAPRLIWCSPRSAKNRSTWLIQDAEVGVKWVCQRGRLAKPVADQLGLVAGGIVQDDVDIEVGRHAVLDRIEEPAELLRPVAWHALADDGSGFRVEGGEQRRRPMPLVIMGPSLGLPRPHRQQRLGPIQGLDLRLSEHQ